MKMSKISCDIIKDLLPLYIDGVCSSDSIDLIEEHLKDCPLCEAEFMNLQNNTDIKPEIDKDIDKAVKNANKKIKKGKKKVVCTVLEKTLTFISFIKIAKNNGTAIPKTIFAPEITRVFHTEFQNFSSSKT